MTNQELLFVYNADSSIFAVATDFVKKIATPEKYDCQLCMVTYGALRMKNHWKEYLDTLPYKKTFLHRDELRSRLPETNEPLPAVFLKNEGSVTTLLSATEINATKSLPELISLMDSKLQTI